MTTFEDGPAKGKTLMLHRAAMFLRVVESKGEIDALDQLTDKANPKEKIYAYKIIGDAGFCHIRASGGRGGFYPIAKYRLYSQQPSDADMRDNEAWTKWVMEKADKTPVEK